MSSRHEEKAAELREMDAPLAPNYKPGDEVRIGKTWLRHWTFREAPKPTQFLWRKLVTEGGGIVTHADPGGIVYVQDWAGRAFGEGRGFPVPARFIYHRRKEELGIARPERAPRGPGYDLDLPSMPPFMYVEDHATLGDLGVIAFGAYNAMGLIGPEKGGVAIVVETPSKAVLATKDFPYDPYGRREEFTRMVGLIRGLLRSAGRGRKEIPPGKREEFVELLRNAGYDLRA